MSALYSVTLESMLTLQTTPVLALLPLLPLLLRICMHSWKAEALPEPVHDKHGLACTANVVQRPAIWFDWCQSTCGPQLKWQNHLPSISLLLWH